MASCRFLHNRPFTLAPFACKGHFTHRLDGPTGAMKESRNGDQFEEDWRLDR